MTDKTFNTFCRLFGGRTDVFTIHSLSLDGRGIYRRACRQVNPSKCAGGFSDCKNCRSGSFLPFSPSVLENHLSGRSAAGLYTADRQGLCSFALITVKDKEFTLQLRILAAVCQKLGLYHLCEITENQSCGRLWIFFGEKIRAEKAAYLAGRIILEAISVTDAVPLTLLNSIFPVPSPRGDMGKPVVLPLFAHKNGYSVFTDDELNPIDDILSFLDEFYPMPWEGLPEGPIIDIEPIKKLEAELCNNIYVSTAGLSYRQAAAICRLAYFPNKAVSGEFKPRIPAFVSCSGFSRGRIHLPRGVMPRLEDMTEEISISDGRTKGTFVPLRLKAKLPPRQLKWASAALERSCGIITAPVGSGKTLAAAGIAAALQRSTLILATESSSAKRWQKSFCEIFVLDGKDISCIISDSDYHNGRIDTAVFIKRTELRLSEYLADYGLVIVADADRLHCGPEIFKNVMECVCAEKVYAITTVPAAGTKYGDYLHLYCGDEITLE